ncbi:MAG: iron-containing alcohol dehydrogenase, partial [Sedimentisphaerales bacterium]
GLALANAGLGAVHGFAGPLGGMISAPHGAICASLLPYVMEINIQALQRREPDSKAIEHYNIIAQILTNKPDSQAANAVEWLHNLCSSLQIPSLGKLGLKEHDFQAAIDKARRSSSMKGNPIQLTDDELYKIMEKAFSQN